MHWGTVLAEVVKIPDNVVRQFSDVIVEDRPALSCLCNLAPPKTLKVLGILHGK